MLALLLLQAAVPQTAIDAERALARAAQTQGQWTALRSAMTDDAITFSPQPASAREALPLKDPPIAVQWWPAASYVACDGSMAVNTGPWLHPKASGYFTTLWVRQPGGGWKWALDHGDALEKPRQLPERPRLRRAACTFVPVSFEPAPCPRETMTCDSGFSPDRTLEWDWQVDAQGRRAFTARLWTGQKYEIVVRDEVAAPAK